MDAGRPGDRLSTCGGRMQPIGLALKSGKINRYGSDSGGEIMLVHYCLSCGKVSCNRIAGDDNAYSILKLLGGETEIDPTLLAIIEENNIDLLTKADEEMVMRALFGNAYLSFVE
ncbi:MAG: hypothetical protein PWQ55_1421 [Chloroflexota bacterium]|nr:hypothetical protein [Chloroflexota bacterium]